MIKVGLLHTPTCTRKCTVIAIWEGHLTTGEMISFFSEVLICNFLCNIVWTIVYLFLIFITRLLHWLSFFYIYDLWSPFWYIQFFFLKYYAFNRFCGWLGFRIIWPRVQLFDMGTIFVRVLTRRKASSSYWYSTKQAPWLFHQNVDCFCHESDENCVTLC